MMTIEEIREFFKLDRYAEFSGIHIDRADENTALCSMKIEAMHLNAGNVVQGGAIFTLADFAFAVSANSGGSLTVSLSNSITFLHPPKGHTLYAKAQKVMESKRTCFYDVTVTDDTGILVAKMSVNGYIKQEK